jgi:hypothetical protein
MSSAPTIPAAGTRESAATNQGSAARIDSQVTGFKNSVGLNPVKRSKESGVRRSGEKTINDQNKAFIVNFHS